MKKIIIFTMLCVFTLSFLATTDVFAGPPCEVTNCIVGEEDGGSLNLDPIPSYANPDQIENVNELGLEIGLDFDSGITYSQTSVLFDSVLYGGVIQENNIYYVPTSFTTRTDFCSYNGSDWLKTGEDLIGSYVSTGAFISTTADTYVDYSKDLYFSRYDTTQFRAYQIYDYCKQYTAIPASIDFSSSYNYIWESVTDLGTGNTNRIMYVSAEKLKEAYQQALKDFGFAERTELENFIAGGGFIGGLAAFLSDLGAISSAGGAAAGIISIFWYEDYIIDGDVIDILNELDSDTNLDLFQGKTIKIELHKDIHTFPYEFSKYDFLITSVDTDSIPVANKTVFTNIEVWGTIDVYTNSKEDVNILLLEYMPQSVLDSFYDLF